MPSWTDIMEEFAGDRFVHNEPFLFHATKDVEDAVSILRDNCIEGHTQHPARLFGKQEGVVEGVSLTRSLRYAARFSDGNPIFVLKRRALQHRYRVLLVDYYGPDYGQPEEWFEPAYRRNEAEEFVVGDIARLDAFLSAVLVTRETLEAIREDAPEVHSALATSPYLRVW